MAKRTIRAVESAARESITFSLAEIAECGRIDPASGWIKFRCPLGRGFEKLFERMDWQVPEEHVSAQKLDGLLKGGNLILTAKGKLVEAEVDLQFKVMNAFSCLRLEIKGHKGKGFRRELRFNVSFEEGDGLARLESYMAACDNAGGSLKVNYYREPVQTEIPEGEQITLDDARREATSKDED